MSKYDISISEVERQPWKDLEYSYLILKLSGKDVNNVVMNTLRRSMIDNIPTYAFPSENITIPKDGNTSVFNNDQMKIRLSQLPIFNMSLDLAYLEQSFWKRVDYSKEREHHPLEKQVEINLSIKNTTNDVMEVTTNDMQYYEDGQMIDNKYNKKYPIVLIELRPNQEFKCHMTGALGVGDNNAIWAGASNAYYKQDKDDYIMTIESNGQFDEYELFWKACKYMQSKMNEIKTLLEDRQTISAKQVELDKSASSNTPLSKAARSVELTLDDETYTIGNLICDLLQNRTDVAYAGTYKPSQLVKTIIIRIEYNKENEQPYAPIYEIMNDIIELMHHLEKSIYKLGGKYMKSVKQETVQIAKEKKEKKVEKVKKEKKVEKVKTVKKEKKVSKKK